MQDELQIDENQKYKPDILVRYYKYYKQQINQFVAFPLSFEKIPIKTCYSKYKKYFDKLSEILEKYKINPDRYIRFCVKNLGVHEPDELLRVDNFTNYANNIKAEDQYSKIYKYYMKSANYVADMCIEKNITPVQFIKELILTNKLAYEYICGNLSMYFIATIGNIDKLCEHLDQNSRDELGIILDVHEKLNQDVQETFIKFKNRRVSPLSLSEDIIKIKTKKRG